MRRAIARWTIEYDADLTRSAYAQLPSGTGCTCAYCRNFDAIAMSVFPADFIALIESLGIDLKKSAEVCNYCREPSGLYLMGGWYHFAGTIVSGPDAWQPKGNGASFHGEQFAECLKIGLSSRLALVRDSFNGLPLIQLEFVMPMPWVLTEPEPDSK